MRPRATACLGLLGVFVAACGSDDSSPDADLINIDPADARPGAGGAADADPGSGGDCASARVAESWVGTASAGFVQRGAGFRTTASVTWQLDTTVDCVDTFRAEGSAEYEVLVPDCAVALDPAAVAIRPGEGVMTIERRNDPPHYTAGGVTSWVASLTVDCDGSSMTTVGYPSGGGWIAVTAQFDGQRIAGDANTLGIAWAWDFSPVP